MTLWNRLFMMPTQYQLAVRFKFEWIQIVAEYFWEALKIAYKYFFCDLHHI